MSQKQLTFENIADIDFGSVALAFNKLLAAAYSDMLDRPSLESSRKVTMSVTLKPHQSKNGPDLKYIEVDIEVGGKTPSQSLSMPMRADAVGILFHTEHTGHQDQPGLDFPADDDKEKDDEQL